MKFEITTLDPGSAARAGRIETGHGAVETPVFLPVATRGSIRCLVSEELEELGYRMLLANAYHLALRPGVEVVAAAGGLHRFMNWPRPILTDSGGFQIFSLAEARVEEAGVVFRSVYDGRRHRLSPEEAVRIQEELGADIIMTLDQPVSHPADRETAAEAVRRTTRWAKRCQAGRQRPEASALFGIVQGSVYPELRAESAAALVELDFPGYALGGFCLGEPLELMNEVVAAAAERLPADKPRYLMGIGTPREIISAVAAGVDIFDCAMPTHIARNGAALTAAGRLTIRNGRYRNDHGPLDPACGCRVCRRYSRAYLRHLFNTRELTAFNLLTYHNLHFMKGLMDGLRAAIEAGRLESFRKSFVDGAAAGL